MKLIDTNTTNIIGEQEAGHAQKVKKQLEGLISGVQKSTFDIAELLYEIKHNGYYSNWGHDTFKGYIKTLTIKEQKARYLARIVETMSIVNILRSAYEPVGLSKLREITSLDTGTSWKNPETGELIPVNDIITMLVTKGQEMSLEDIKQYVRMVKGLTDENELVWMNFCVKKSVKDEVVKPALDLAKANIGTVGKDDDGMAVDASDGKALEMICVEYNNDPANQYRSE